jgi:hypothetical protein
MDKRVTLCNWPTSGPSMQTSSTVNSQQMPMKSCIVVNIASPARSNPCLSFAHRSRERRTAGGGLAGRCCYQVHDGCAVRRTLMDRKCAIVNHREVIGTDKLASVYKIQST